MSQEENEENLVVESTKTIQCQVCSQSFTRKYSLTRHLKVHNKVANEYECGTCGTKFRKKSRLGRHQKKHVPKKVLKCPGCDRSYIRPDHFQSHLKTCDDVEVESEAEADIKVKLEGIVKCLGYGKPESILGIGIPFQLSEDDSDHELD